MFRFGYLRMRSERVCLDILERDETIWTRDVQTRSSSATVLRVLDVSLLQHHFSSSSSLAEDLIMRNQVSCSRDTSKTGGTTILEDRSWTCLVKTYFFKQYVCKNTRR